MRDRKKIEQDTLEDAKQPTELLICLLAHLQIEILLDNRDLLKEIRDAYIKNHEK